MDNKWLDCLNMIKLEWVQWLDKRKLNILVVVVEMMVVEIVVLGLHEIMDLVKVIVGFHVMGDLLKVLWNE